jgi:hypothetical protein
LELPSNSAHYRSDEEDLGSEVFASLAEVVVAIDDPKRAQKLECRGWLATKAFCRWITGRRGKVRKRSTILRALRKASRQLRSSSPLPLADLVYTPGDPLCGLCFASAVGRVRLAWRLLA